MPEQRLEDIELRRIDEARNDEPGTQRVLDPTTAGDFTRHFGAADTKPLVEAIDESRLRVWQQQPEGFMTEAIIPDYPRSRMDGRNSVLTEEDYCIPTGTVTTLSLPGCPVHGEGGCGLARHGTYERVSPPGTRIARWYCPQAHCTFSLLPDHLAARFPPTGSLQEIEAVVVPVEQARSVEAAADALRRDDITLASAVRWVRRRLSPVRALLIIVVGSFPSLLLGCAPTMTALRQRLACEVALYALREVAEPHLAALRPPLGFRHPSQRGAKRRDRYHTTHSARPAPRSPRTRRGRSRHAGP